MTGFYILCYRCCHHLRHFERQQVAGIRHNGEGSAQREQWQREALLPVGRDLAGRFAR